MSPLRSAPGDNADQRTGFSAKPPPDETAARIAAVTLIGSILVGSGLAADLIVGGPLAGWLAAAFSAAISAVLRWPALAAVCVLTTASVIRWLRR